MSDPQRFLAEQFSQSTRATSGEVDQLVQDVLARQSTLQRSPPKPRAFFAALVLVPVAAAAAALLMVPSAPPPPTPMAQVLDSGSGPSTMQLLPGVSLTLQGTGTVHGTSDHPEVDWSSGALEVSVDPGSVSAFTVHTSEGSVEVIGTVFRVERTALGTEVSVVRGTVRTACVQGETVLLEATEDHACLPTTAGGMLGRARALKQRGASPLERQQALEAGLALGPSAAMATELRLQLILLLQDQGQLDAAWSHIPGALAEATTGRRDALLRLAMSLAEARGDCDGAQQVWLEHGGDPTSADALAACSGP